MLRVRQFLACFLAFAKLIGKNGDTVETVRELIGVSPRIAARIEAYQRAHPEDGPAFAAVLSFRRKVAEEFERMVRA